jgi:hypothetical protein
MLFGPSAEEGFFSLKEAISFVPGADVFTGRSERICVDILSEVL